MKKVLFLILIASLSFFVFALDQSELTSALLTNNADIRKAQEEVSKALLDLKDAKAGYGPTVDLTITGSYIANPIDPIRINLGDYISSPLLGSNDYVTIYNGQENMYYQFSLQLTQPIFTWGKLSMAEKVYKAVHEARVLQLDDSIAKAQTELLTRVAALNYLIQIQEVLDSQMQITERLVQLADEAQANGMMLASDALAVKVQASQLSVAKAQIDQQVLLMVTNIESLTGLKGLDVSDIVFDEKSLEDKLASLLDMGYSSLLSKCLSDSRTTFCLLSKMNEISILSKNIAGASVNWKPDFALVVNADYSGSRFPGLEKDWTMQDDWSATVTVAMKTTIYDGGKAVRNVSRAASDVSESQIDSENAKAKVSCAVVENWSNLSVYQTQMAYQEALMAQLDEKIEVSKKLLDTGYGSESDYLQGVLERNNCEIQILQTKINLASAVYTLMYLEGEISSI